MKKQRGICIGLALALLLCRQAYGVELSATAAVLMDADSGQVLLDKNGDKRMKIASTTKLLTALVVLECCDLQDTVTVKDCHMAEGSSMYLKAGETVTVEELLYGLLLCSGNDASLALAEACGGPERCVAHMNRLAAELSMTDSHFENTSGLDAQAHYSTARDMARLAARCMEHPTLRRICSTITARAGTRTMTNHNRLLRSVEGCVGMKTGYTMASGRTLVSAAVRSGRHLVAVTLQDGNDWADHEAMYRQGFEETAPEEAAFRMKKRQSI